MGSETSAPGMDRASITRPTEVDYGAKRNRLGRISWSVPGLSSKTSPARTRLARGNATFSGLAPNIEHISSLSRAPCAESSP